jgi:hypothetical protein
LACLLFGVVEAAADGGVVAIEVLGDLAEGVAVVVVGAFDRVRVGGEELFEFGAEWLPVGAGDLFDEVSLADVFVEEVVSGEVDVVADCELIAAGGRVVDEVFDASSGGGAVGGELGEYPVGG